MENLKVGRREITFECPLCARSWLDTLHSLTFIIIGIIPALQMKLRLKEAEVTQLDQSL